MATYYVDFVNGADANNGLGPDASDGTNKPWKTIAKLLGAAGMASGDTAYLSPAGPFREVVTVAMTSAVAETKIIGDPANAQGFKTSGGVRVAPGQVRWTAYTTNDKTAPSATTLNLSGRDFLTFENIFFVGGSGDPTTIQATTATSSACKFTDCSFVQGYTSAAGGIVTLTSAFGVALNFTFDRCWFVTAQAANGSGATVRCTRGTGADYDVNVVFSNCAFVGAWAGLIQVSPSGAGANFGNGVKIRNCSCFGAAFIATGASTSASIASTVTNCFIYSGTGVAVTANTSGQITEDYNLIVASTPRTNVTAGTHSISDGSYAPLFHFGQELKYGAQLRPFGAPMAGSPLLAFGNDGTQTAYDLDNNPRPAGGASASAGVGARERGNSWGQEVSTVHTGSNALSITGPGYQDFDLPVDVISTTPSVYVRWDATYAGTKPILQVLNGTECGVADATATATGSADNWEQLSLNFTPTRAGIVTIRLLSSDTNGGGKAFADDFDVA